MGAAGVADATTVGVAAVVAVAAGAEVALPEVAAAETAGDANAAAGGMSPSVRAIATLPARMRDRITWSSSRCGVRPYAVRRRYLTETLIVFDVAANRPLSPAYRT